ncbi:MAG: bifunctional homocysteine S-methyltransferase/methylenetetrahydrofolate reductase [Armatimonadetes bacterium]|nr:bifunctional homocysteine S-methyltransferase/methylenetetrahydrofolate reductase [Armatimonadota bacterium]
MNPFAERLSEGVLLSDGAMGTLLYARGVSQDQCFELQSVARRDLVLAVHLEYIQAGADLIETNTYAANRLKLARFGLADRVGELNRASAKLAKEARDVSGTPVFIGGAIGPLGKPLAPYGLVSVPEATAIFREQIDGLVEGGADFLVLETFSDLDEMRLAVGVAKSCTDLPIVAHMTFNEDGHTLRGHTPTEVARALAALGVAALGANCSVGPLPMVDVVAQMVAAVTVPVSAMPNAGFPRRVEGRMLYTASPHHLAEQAGRMAALGARILGGCCGTTPEHIAAMAVTLRDRRPSEAAARPPARPRAASPVETVAYEPTALSRKIGTSFVISVEIDPPKGTDATKDLLGAEMLQACGADAINVGDSPLGRVRMSATSMCVQIQQRLDLETIIHFTTRDRNLMALQADLIGLHALGIRNVLALTGDPPRGGDYGEATTVYDTDSIGLIRILRRLNEGTDLAGKPIGRPASFCVACAFDMNPQTLDREMRRLEQKIAAGADFIMTQPIFEPEVLDRFLQRFGAPPKPMLLGVLPLHSSRHAEFLHHEVPGINIPEWARDRMRDAGNNGREEGLRLSAELLDAVADRITGVYLMPSFGRYEVSAELVKRLRARRPTLTRPRV